MHIAFSERMTSVKARQRLSVLKQSTSVDDYARQFSGIVSNMAGACKAELAFAFHRGLKPDIVEHLTSRIDLESDTWTVIRDKAADIDEVMFQQSRGKPRSLNPE